MQGGVGDSMRRHPSSLAPPERHRRFGPWGILAAAASAGALVAGGVLAITLVTSSEDEPTAQVMGERAPEFRLSTVDGQTTIRLSDLRGRVVVVTFGDSRSAEAALDRLWRHFRAEGVAVMSVRSDLSSLAATIPPTPAHGWPVLGDPGGRTAEKYGVERVPETFVISADGRVVAGLSGTVTYPVLLAQVSMLLGLTGPTRRPAADPSST
jgi:peroxiredoxin